MEYKRLGTSELLVSEICLGTMTYGQQNTIVEAHEQLDYAIAQGINFIDMRKCIQCRQNLKLRVELSNILVNG